jgi:hypothetical protein
VWISKNTHDEGVGPGVGAGLGAAVGAGVEAAVADGDVDGAVGDAGVAVGPGVVIGIGLGAGDDPAGVGEVEVLEHAARRTPKSRDAARRFVFICRRR